MEVDEEVFALATAFASTFAAAELCAVNAAPAATELWADAPPLATVDPCAEMAAFEAAPATAEALAEAAAFAAAVPCTERTGLTAAVPLAVTALLALAAVVTVAAELIELVVLTESWGLKDNAGSLGNSILTLGHKHCGGRKGMNKHCGPQGDRSVICVPVSLSNRFANTANRFARLGTPGTPLPKILLKSLDLAKSRDSEMFCCSDSDWLASLDNDSVSFLAMDLSRSAAAVFSRTSEMALSRFLLAPGMVKSTSRPFLIASKAFKRLSSFLMISSVIA